MGAGHLAGRSSCLLVLEQCGALSCCVIQLLPTRVRSWSTAGLLEMGTLLGSPRGQAGRGMLQCWLGRGDPVEQETHATTTSMGEKGDCQCGEEGVVRRDAVNCERAIATGWIKGLCAATRR
jgi:hypothetical protein